MENETFVSIIIPLIAPNDYLKECIKHCLNLDYDNYEILVLTDEPAELNYPRTQVIPTGHVPPSEKRDIGARYANGEVLAFIDDDAYPTEGWLKHAIKHFRDDEVAGVGGPAVTPPDDNFMQKAGGYVLSSFMGGGSYSYRYIPEKLIEVDDYPTCNLLVRKSTFHDIGGFDTCYWPGEDTKLCLDITKKQNKKIIYEPEALVYHHRRPLFRPHLKQIWSYAVHRGFFSKKFPETSFRLSYFLPTLWIFWAGAGLIAAMFSPLIRFLYMVSVMTYLLAAMITGLKTGNFFMSIAVASGIISTHMVYGIGFVFGRFSRDLVR